MKKTALFVIILVLLAMSVYCFDNLISYDGPQSSTTSRTAGSYWGLVFQANFNGSVAGINRASGANPTYCELRNYTSMALLSNGTFSGDYCQLATPVQINYNRYYVALVHDTASFTSKFGNSYGYLPSNKGYIKWNSTKYSMDGSIWNEDTGAASANADSVNGIVISVGGPNITIDVSITNYSLNLTSNGGQLCGYNRSGNYKVCTTDDGTPTFKFNTYGYSTCKISNQANSYTNLSLQGIPDCSTTGNIVHACTYPEPLSNGTYTIYFSCKSGTDEISNWSFYPTNMANLTIYPSINSSQNIANEALDLGITRSAIWPGALIYTNQPIYIRTKENYQAFGTFDKLAVYGNQRWALNYVVGNEGFISTPTNTFYNITPVFYFMEIANVSYFNTILRVASFINSTKTN